MAFSKSWKQICKNHFKLEYMKYEITKEQILEAHKSACGDWKKKIESWFPDVFKNTLEVGKWYKAPNLGFAIFFITKITGDNFNAYGLNYKGIWVDENDWVGGIGEGIIPATDTEVSEMLIKEAKKRGFVQGVTVESCVMSGFIRKIGKENYKFTKYNQLTTGSITLFENGKWATIVEQPTEMTHDEIEKVLGKKIKIVTK